MPILQEDHEQYISSSFALLAVMASYRRLEILDILMQGEISVGKLCDEIGASQSSVSQHLAILRKAKIVDTRKAGQTIFYSCSSYAVARVLECLWDVADFAEPGDTNRPTLSS